MGLFASIGSFFKDYHSIIFDKELNYSSGNIDVSKTTYLRRDNIFLENAIYYNQLRYKLVNKAFEINERTFTQGLTRIPVKQLIDIKKDYIDNLQDTFSGSCTDVVQRYRDILKFRTSIVETLLSCVTFAAHIGDIDRALVLLKAAIDDICRDARSFSEEISSIESSLEVIADQMEAFASISSYEDYVALLNQGNDPIEQMIGGLYDIVQTTREMLFKAATGRKPGENDTLTDDLITAKYANPYQEEYHNIIESKDTEVAKNLKAKLSVPQDYFTGYRTWSDALYLDLRASDNILIQNGSVDTPIIVEKASDLSISNVKIDLGENTDSDSDVKTIFYKLVTDINVQDIAGSGLFNTENGIMGNAERSIYIDLNGHKLQIPNSITLGTTDVDEDSEDLSGTVNISNGEISFINEMVTNSKGKYDGDPLTINVKGGSSLEAVTISFKEDTKGIFDLDKIRKRDILEINLSQGSSFANSVLENSTDYGMIFSGKYPRVIINEKVSDIIVDNIHGNNVDTLHNKHLIFKIYFPVFWSSVGNVSTGSRAAKKLVTNELSVGTDGEEDVKVLSNDGGKVRVNYSITENIYHIAKDTNITSLPVYYVRDSGSNRVYSTSNEEDIESLVIPGENGKKITFLQFNIVNSGGSKTTEGLFHFQYDDGSILTEYVKYSAEDKAIKDYFYEKEGLSNIEKLGKSAEDAIKDLKGFRDEFNKKIEDLTDSGGSDIAAAIAEAFATAQADLRNMVSNIVANLEGSIQIYEDMRSENIKHALNVYRSNVELVNNNLAAMTYLDDRRAGMDPHYTKQFIQDILDIIKKMVNIVSELYDGADGIDALELAVQIAETGSSEVQSIVKDVNNIKHALDAGMSADQLHVADIFLQKKTETIYELEEVLEATHKALDILLQRTIDTNCELIDIIDQYSVNMPINDTESGFVSAINSFLQADSDSINDEGAVYNSKFIGRSARTFDNWLSTLQAITGTQPIYEAAILYVIAELGIMCGRISPSNVHTSKKSNHAEILSELLNRSILLISRKGLWTNFTSEDFKQAIVDEEFLYSKKGLRVSKQFMYENVDSVILTLFPKIREFNDYDILQLLHSQYKSLDLVNFNECKFIFLQELLSVSKDPQLLNDLVISAMDGFEVERRSIRTRLLEGPFYSAVWDYFFVSYHSILKDDVIDRLLRTLLSRRNIRNPDKTIIYTVEIENNRISEYGFLDYIETDINENIKNIRAYVNTMYNYRMISGSSNSIDSITPQFYLDYSDNDLASTISKYLNVYNFYYDAANSLATYLSTDLILEKIPFYKIIEGEIDYKRGIYQLSNAPMVQITSPEMIDEDEIYYYKRVYNTGKEDRFLKLEYYHDASDVLKVPISVGDSYESYNKNDKFLLEYFVDYRNYFINSETNKLKLLVPPLGFKMYYDLFGNDNTEIEHGGNADVYKTANSTTYLKFKNLKDLGYLAPPFIGDTVFKDQSNMEYFIMCAKAYVMNNVIYKKFTVTLEDFHSWIGYKKNTSSGKYYIKIENAEVTVTGDIFNNTFPIYSFGSLSVRGVIISCDFKDPASVRRLRKNGKNTDSADSYLEDEMLLFMCVQYTGAVTLVIGICQDKDKIDLVALYDDAIKPNWDYYISYKGYADNVFELEKSKSRPKVQYANIHDVIQLSEDISIFKGNQKSADTTEWVQLEKYNTSSVEAIYQVKEPEIYEELIQYFQVSGLTQKFSSVEKYFISKYISSKYKMSANYTNTLWIRDFNNNKGISDDDNDAGYIKQVTIYRGVGSEDDDEEFITLTTAQKRRLIGGFSVKEITFLKLIYKASLKMYKGIFADGATRGTEIRYRENINKAFDIDAYDVDVADLDADGNVKNWKDFFGSPDEDDDRILGNKTPFSETEGIEIYTVMENFFQRWIDDQDRDVENALGDIMACNYYGSNGIEIPTLRQYSANNRYRSSIDGGYSINKPILSTEISGIMYKYVVEKYLSGNGNVDLYRKIPNIYNTMMSQISDFLKIYTCDVQTSLSNNNIIQTSNIQIDSIFGIPQNNVLTPKLYNDLKADTEATDDIRLLKYYVQKNRIYRGVFERVQFTRNTDVMVYPDVGSAMDSYCNAIRNLNKRDGNKNLDDANDTGFVENGLVIAVDNRAYYDRSLLMKNFGRTTIDQLLESIAPVIIPQEYYESIKNPHYGYSTNEDDNIIRTVKSIFEQDTSLLQRLQIKKWFKQHTTFYYFVDIYCLTERVNAVGTFTVDEGLLKDAIDKIFEKNDAISIMIGDSVLALHSFGIFSTTPFMIVDKNKSQTNIERIGYQIDDKWLNLTDIYNLDLYTRKDYLYSGLDIISALTNVDNIGYGLYNEYIAEFQTDTI